MKFTSKPARKGSESEGMGRNSSNPQGTPTPLGPRQRHPAKAHKIDEAALPSCSTDRGGDSIAMNPNTPPLWLNQQNMLRADVRLARSVGGRGPPPPTPPRVNTLI